MDEILQQLQAMVDNPDDLSNLPNAINQLTEYHTTNQQRESEDLERITRLQDANRNLLSQIPVNTGEPTEPPKDDKVTFEQAQDQFLNAMNNVGGI